MPGIGTDVLRPLMSRSVPRDKRPQKLAILALSLIGISVAAEKSGHMNGQQA